MVKWPDRVTTQINRGAADRLYPYRTLSVVPTQDTIILVCKRCRVGSQPILYVDARDYAVATGIPNPLHGGIKKGERFYYAQCGSCLTFYRTNDWKIVSNVSMVDIGISPRLNTVEDIGVGPPDEPEAWSIQANIADVFQQDLGVPQQQTFGQGFGQGFQKNFTFPAGSGTDAFTDDFEPTGFTVVAGPYYIVNKAGFSGEFAAKDFDTVDKTVRYGT
jgi:hypothetical protein